MKPGFIHLLIFVKSDGIHAISFEEIFITELLPVVSILFVVVATVFTCNTCYGRRAIIFVAIYPNVRVTNCKRLPICQSLWGMLMLLSRLYPLFNCQYPPSASITCMNKKSALC